MSSISQEETNEEKPCCLVSLVQIYMPGAGTVGDYGQKSDLVFFQIHFLELSGGCFSLDAEGKRRRQRLASPRLLTATVMVLETLVYS